MIVSYGIAMQFGAKPLFSDVSELEPSAGSVAIESN
jgi:hypothetical protein